MSRLALLMLLAISACSTPVLDDQCFAARNFRDFQTGFAGSAKFADRIVVARLISATPRARADRFELDSEWKLIEPLKGGQEDIPNVRFLRDVRGWVEGAVGGSGTLIYPNETYLLFLSDEVYARRSEARGGCAVIGSTGTGLSYALVQGEQIVRVGVTDEWPATLTEVRARLK